MRWVCKQQILSVLLILKVYFTSILKDDISGFKIFDCCFIVAVLLLLLLFLWALWICFPLLLASIISPEKSTVNHIEILFEVKSHFPITSFKRCKVIVFSIFGKILALISQIFFSAPLFFYWYFCYEYACVLNGILQFSEAMFIFLHYFCFLLFSLQTTAVYSSSLILHTTS